MKPARIGIIGSANADLVVRADHTPAPGENVLGDDLRMIPGGKGANQAVAVARLGGRARFIGRVGRESFGKMLLASLRGDGVETDDLAAVADAPTGVALIVIDRNGQNSIVVAPGANRRLMPADVQALRPVLEKLDAILMQLEIPIETVVHTIRLAREIHVPVILDAGPARTQ
ncbi:MAG: PfkB family carbohydrate kinase, partial [Candidatus Brocadiia bacterium]